MQLIQRTTLVYQAGRTEKVYEVDLCQVSEGAYVVNFRYGRQGTALKEGSETVSAVPLEMAQRIFDRLINAKLRKGYRVSTGEANPPETTASPTPAPVETPIDPNVRSQAILNRLAAALQSPASTRPPAKKWPLNRVIWRAGELKIQAAAPLLLQLWGQEDLRNYCIAWALGQCGDQSTYTALEQRYRQPGAEFVRRITLEALFKLGTAAQRDALRQELTVQLPPDLRTLTRQGPASALTQTLKSTLDPNASPQTLAVLDLLYQIDSEVTRPAVLEVIQTAPLRPSYFQRLRHIFKMAEYRQDTEVFGLLAYRFEQEKALYRNQGYGVRLPEGEYLYAGYTYNSRTGRYERTTDNPITTEQRRPDTRLAFSDKTRDYLRRRVWRTLRKLGQARDPSYVTFAVDLLLQYADEDAGSIRESVFYHWDWRNSYSRVETGRVNWDLFAGYLAFNHVLYEQSPRYVLKPANKAWRCQSSYKPGDPAPPGREEAFPHLWDQQPVALLRLLSESGCQSVHEFAVKAIRASRSFLEDLPLESVILLLERPYEITAQLGFEIAQARYDASQPNRELMVAIATCNYAPARQQAQDWITAQRDVFLNDSQLIAQLVTCKPADMRAFARRLLSTALLEDTRAQAILGQVIAILLNQEPENIPSEDWITDISETLFLSFGTQLRTLGLEVVLDILRYPAAEMQTFGARILLNHSTPVTELPPGLIDALIDSPFDSVRVVGVRLLSQLPDTVLMEQTGLLLTLIAHPLAEMRLAIRPAIQRIAAAQLSFSQHLAQPLLEVLQGPEETEGIHRFLTDLLRQDLPGWMDNIIPEQVHQLLGAESPAAQEIAGYVLQHHCDRWSATLPTADIAQFTHHDMLSVRTAGWQMLSAILPRLRQSETDLLDIVRVLESTWEDTRQFGYKLFRDDLKPDELTPAVVISICDSNLPQVRQLGRDLVGRCFRDADGEGYLLKFSEHPATDMQLFATQYLQTYVVDNPQRLQELTPYFTRVLAQVNRGRVTKQRVYAFLEAEATKSLTAAEIIAEILTRQSVTIAICDRARALEILLKIHSAYPQISVPLQVKPVAVREPAALSSSI